LSSDDSDVLISSLSLAASFRESETPSSFSFSSSSSLPVSDSEETLVVANPGRSSDSSMVLSGLWKGNINYELVNK
jgi:hypothetical protein